jgi:acyl carrier protein
MMISFEDITARVSETLSVPVEDLKPETTLKELAADSFLLVEMVVDLQEEYGTTFSQADLLTVGNLGELADLIRAHVRSPL